MCGICGIYNFAHHEPVDAGVLEAASHTIRHRGPDDQGLHLDGDLGLAFRRLAVIDLDGGHQPMSDQQERTWVVFNGEIYNYRELRAELMALGCVFRTHSDTEVIVHGYAQWGDAFLDRLNGMFAIALWDARARRLLLARDPMGIKPLYYRIESGSVSFGSEIRAVLSLSRDAGSLNPDALYAFLRYRYTPSPNTLYKGVSKLAPGQLLDVRPAGATTRMWYRYRPATRTDASTPEEAAEELLSLYRRAVKRQLVSDVPVGLLLSGGVDSGLLLALMNENGSGWPTYSVGYGSTYRDDELTDAEETARIFGSRHTSVLLSTSDFERLLPAVVASLEEPVAAASVIPMHAVCARARQDVTVAFAGQGPDELFGGYLRHLGVRYQHLWNLVPSAAREALSRALLRLPRSATLKRGARSLRDEDQFSTFQRVLSVLPGDGVAVLFRPGVIDGPCLDALPQAWSDIRPDTTSVDALNAFQMIELRSTLPDELLVYSDKLSMASSLEVRVPFLDKEIVEYAQRLPAAMKIALGRRKYVHKLACSRLLPRAIINRRKKGFAGNVVDDWFRLSLSGRLDDVLLDGQSLMYEFLDQSAVTDLLSRHRTGREDNHKVLFSLVVVEWWLRVQRDRRVAQ